MAEATKDTIYIDVDDEITNIIEKVKDSPHGIVALVLPKRATVLQSIVNMKLLKRSAHTAKKKVVLITSEAGLLPLAGAVGLHVAKNLQSKPEVPDAPEVMPKTHEAVIDEGELEDNDDKPVDKKKSIGELAGMTAVSASNAGDKPKKEKPAKAPKQKKDSKFKIPNFEKFRSRLFLIILGVIGFFVFLYWAFFMAPSAKITVVTDTETINSNITFTADKDATALDVGDKILPARIAESKEVESETVAATGSKDVGEKASGSVSMTAKNCSGIATPASVDSGWAVTSGGLTYVTQSTTNFTFDSISGGCVYFTGSTTIVAQNGGEKYNTAASASFSVNNRSDITATGSATGGTDKTIKVVAQKDLDEVADKLAGKDEETAKSQLRKELEDAGYYVIDASFKKSKPSVSSSPEVGSEASEATVTVTTTYSITGVKRDDLDKLISETNKADIDESRQQIVNTGLDGATFEVDGNQITVDSIVLAGPKLDVPATIEQVAGKKRSEVITIIEANPGVKQVRIDYSPFWVTSTPKKTSKIQIVFEDSGDEQQQ